MICFRQWRYVLFVLLLLPVSVMGQNVSVSDTIAGRYLGAVEAMDWQAMASLLAPNAVFEDPTAETFGEPWRVEGGQQIADFYRKQAEESETISTRYHVRDSFSTGQRTLFDLEVEVRVSAGPLGFPDDVIEDVMHVVTIITVEEGKVIHHIDYANYAEMFERLDVHLRRLEAKYSESNER